MTIGRLKLLRITRRDAGGSRTVAVVLLLTSLAGVGVPREGRAQHVESGLGVEATNNVFGSVDEEGDGVLRPYLDMGGGLGPWWEVGYAGQASLFLLHPELTSTWHQVRATASRLLGDEGQHELYASFSTETMRFGPDYAAINLVKPQAEAGLALEPSPWLRVVATSEVSARVFYDDSPADALDAWALLSTTVTSPTRTTLTGRLRAGTRLLTRSDRSPSRDIVDVEVEAGVHASQGLWETAGLQADLAVRQAEGPNDLLGRELTPEQFTFLGDEFMSTGARAELGLKQLLGVGWSVLVGVRLENRLYGGWPAYDADGDRLPTDRHDVRLSPRIQVVYAWVPRPSWGALLPGVEVRGEHAFTRQWSTSALYDTVIHASTVAASVSW